MEPSSVEPIRCPNCDELVQPIVTDDIGFRCPLCREEMNERVVSMEINGKSD